LLESGEAEQVRGRHLDYFLGLAEEAEPKLLGAEQVTWFNQLETEHDNLRAAMEWSLQDGEIEKGLRLASALWWLWYMRGHVSEGQNRLRQVLTRPEAAGRTAARAKALNVAGFLHGVADNQTEARPLLEEALAIGRELRDPWSIATSLRFLGSVATNLGDYVAAQSFLEEGLEIWRQLGPTAKHGTAWSLVYLGDLALAQGNYEQAQTLYGESAILLSKVVDKSLLADPFRRMAHVALHQGDWQKATVLCQESLDLNLEVGHKQGIAACLAGLAEIAAARGHTIRAAQLFGAVGALLDETATLLLPADRTEYHRNVASTRAQLSEAAFEAAWTEGAAMTLGQAIVFASTESETLLKEEATAPSLSPLQAAKEQFDGLTAREREVAALVAQGKSNRDIADTLVVSERTAAAHVSNILSKLEFTSRTQIAKWAIEKGLVAPSTNQPLSER
jgi:non-specific serine/threonine protein kinase